MPSIHPLYYIFLILLSNHLISATSTTKYLLPLTKDSTKNQFYTNFQVGTPPVPVSVIIDLSSHYSWFTCNIIGYNKSSTWSVVPCDTHCTEGCNVACSGPAIPTTSCTHKSCGGYAYTPWINYLFGFGLITDTITLHSTSFPRHVTSLPKYPFVCTFKDVLKGLSPHAKGILALARTPTSLHAHVSSFFNTPHKFAICPPSGSSSGALYFGGGPYILKPNRFDLSKSFITTALVVDPYKTEPIFEQGDSTIKYFVNLKSIKIDRTILKFNTSLLSFDKLGKGGTVLSTIDPYGVLCSEIYKPFVDLFVEKAEALGLVKVASVAPFGACFSSRSVRNHSKTNKVPIIDLVFNEKSELLHGKNARWRIYGSNSMVRVSRDVECLGFVDGGDAVNAPISIGAHQFEDNLVEFDLKANKLRFTNSLLRLGTSCSQFKGH